MIKPLILTLLPALALFACTSTALITLPTNEQTIDQIEENVRQKVQQSNLASNVNTTGAVGWSNVYTGGGGYITGIQIHPTTPNVVYIRTDISGWFRWDETTQIWTPLTDFITAGNSNDYGGEGIALDPSNPDWLYIATGNYSASWAPMGKIYRSKDRGATWEKISPNWNVKMGGGEFRRWAGERLAVSPSNKDVILFGSRHDALWRTADGGKTWQQQTFSGLDGTYGVQSILFDRQNAGRVYAVMFGLGVYQSDDNGSSWNLLRGSPNNGMRLALSSTGTLWVTRADGVSKFENGTWTSVTPSGHPSSAYSAIAVNPFDSNDVVVAPIELFTTAPTYRTKDNGQTWQPINWTFKANMAWIEKLDFGLANWLNTEQAAFAFDPHQQNRFWMTNWFSASRSDTMNATAPQLEDLNTNLENTVTLALTTNASGQLLSGSADTGGFFHDMGLNAFPSSLFSKPPGQDYSWNFTTGLAAFPLNPNVIYRVGCTCWSTSNGIVKSSDGGKTWTSKYQWPKVNDQRVSPLRVAVSPTSENNLVVVRYNAVPQYSIDGGATWSDSSGLPSGENNLFYWGQPLTADGAQANTFYYYNDAKGEMLKSTDSGRTFTTVASNLWNSSGASLHGNLKATPGKAGNLWLSLENNGLMHSTDGGMTWQKLAKVTYAQVFGFGKPARSDAPPTMYLYGAIDGVDGIWMSVDSNERWINIQNPKIQIGSFPAVLEGSPTEFGRIFVGTTGRGIFTFTLGTN
jgi:xyloglucan-specific exo-beta-1,4-glucanase